MDNLEAPPEYEQRWVRVIVETFCTSCLEEGRDFSRMGLDELRECARECQDVLNAIEKAEELVTSASRKQILVVDDSLLTLELYRTVLGASGYSVIHSRDGHNTISLVEKHCPDLILMDIHLPEISGLEITRKLKANPGTKDIPIIVITADAMKGTEERALLSGCDAFLTKPVYYHKFQETVLGFLEQ